MTTNMLQKEEEYYKLNEELQSYNKKLMEEFSDILKKQENLLKESVHNEISLDCTQSLCQTSDLRSDNKVFNYTVKGTKQNVLDHDLDLCVPESVNCIGMKGMIHFYKAKLAALQNEFSMLQREYKDKFEEVKKFMKENIKLTEERDKWHHACVNNKDNVNKLENQLAVLSSKHQVREGEIIALTKEIDKLRKHLKCANLKTSNCEVRLNRVVKENEKLEDSLKTAREEIKTLREAHRKEIIDATVVRKRLEKQKIELLAAFKKQLQLVDNLKKQKAYLESSNLAEISEAAFLRILDQK